MVDLLKEFEGFRGFVYDDSTYPSVQVYEGDCYLSGSQYKVASTGGTATIGYGETSTSVVSAYWDTPIAEPDAADLLQRRATNDYLAPALGYVALGIQLTPHEQAAVGSFVYNIGVGAWQTSTVLRLINNGSLDPHSYSNAFHLWDDGGILAARRQREVELFLATDYSPVQPDSWTDLFVPVLVSSGD